MHEGGYGNGLQSFFARHVFSSRWRFFLSLFIPLTFIYSVTAVSVQTPSRLSATTPVSEQTKRTHYGKISRQALQVHTPSLPWR
jgi:hypothetical protein